MSIRLALAVSVLGLSLGGIAEPSSAQATPRNIFNALPDGGAQNANARLWLAGDKRIDELSFLIAAFGISVAGEDGGAGCSDLLWAKANGALTPAFETHLKSRMTAAISMTRFREELQRTDIPLSVLGAMQKSALYGQDGYHSLVNDLRGVHVALRGRDAESRIALMKTVNSFEDVRRARP